MQKKRRKKTEWDKYDEAFEKGLWPITFKVLLYAVPLLFILGGIGYMFSLFGEASSVVREEMGPRALLKKYEWFKDASAQLDKKSADIQVYEVRVKSIENSYEGVSRKDWAREDREQHSLWLTESAGVKASFNSLASEYNAQMAKINWAFTNVGQLPQGATQPLPREYKTYLIN